MKILFACSEYHPLIRTDEVADFNASLSRTIGQFSHDIRVILPAYPDAVDAALPVKTVTTLDFAGCEETVRILQGKIDGQDFPVYLIEAPAMFSRHGHPYQDAQGQPKHDNLKRFALFSQAVTMIALNHAGMNWKPDIVHCNDWQTGLVPALLAQDWNRPATVFTAHRLARGNDFPPEQLQDLKLPSSLKNSQNCRVNGRFSPTRAGFVYSDCCSLNTLHLRQELLPEAYAKLFDSLGNRLNLLGFNLDEERWNPVSDPYISQPYDDTTFNLKRRNKTRLQQMQNLDEDENSLLISIFSNLTDDDNNDQQVQLQSLYQLLENDRVQLLVHCKSQYPRKFEQKLADTFAGRVSLCIQPDEALLHHLLAGSDAALFGNSHQVTRLLPQVCCIYGTVPVIGQGLVDIDGLVDATSENLMKNRATAFFYANTLAENMLPAVNRMIQYHGRSGPWWSKLASGCMQQFKANSQIRLEYAHQYLACYQYAIDNPVSNPDQS